MCVWANSSFNVDNETNPNYEIDPKCIPHNKAHKTADSLAKYTQVLQPDIIKERDVGSGYFIKGDIVMKRSI